jgi:tetratricopeptide (TPR) repeat protein
MEVLQERSSDSATESLADMYLTLGKLYMKTGKVQESSEYYKLFRQYADVTEEKVTDPADQYLVFEQEGDIYYKSADYEKALEFYNKAKDGYVEILSKNPSDALALRNLIAMHSKIGGAYLQMPVTFRQEAINCFIRMFNKSFELLRLDDSNPEYMQVVATSAYNAAIVQIKNPEFRDLKQLETLLNTSYHFWRQLYERCGSDEYKEKCNQIETIYSSIFE